MTTTYVFRTRENGQTQMKHVISWMEKNITSDFKIKDQLYVASTSDPELEPIAATVMCHGSDVRTSNYLAPNRKGLARMVRAVQSRVLEQEDEVNQDDSVQEKRVEEEED